MLEHPRDFFPVIPLDFNHAVFDRPPSTARLFEVFQQGFVVVRGEVQVLDECHHLAAAAFGGALYDGSLLCGRKGNAPWGGWLPFA